MDFLIEFESDRLGYGHVVLEGAKGLGVVNGVTAVIGRNGSGKTTFGTVLEKGRYAYGNRIKFNKEGTTVKMLSFTDIHSLSNMETQYFAQRMESTANDYVPDVATVLGKKAQTDDFDLLSEKLGLKNVKDKKINYLSSGELRKLIIINALLTKPGLLILDNPYIGLDAPSRKELNNMLEELKNEGISIVLLVCDKTDIPEFTDAVMTVEERRLSPATSLKDYLDNSPSKEENGNDEKFDLPERPTHKMKGDYEVAFEIRKGHVKYGDKQILKDVDWRINKGEQWALTGPNGCGKSLLLSMVCADNPQGYANDITLFDRRRGSGESIWEIKDNIGYVSPEMQLFFKSNSDVREIVVQGMRNSLNRYAKPTEKELAEADKWLELTGISHLADRKFNELSAGEQRLVLVARAMISQPELLVLDEPLHGLDAEAKLRVRSLIDQMVTRNGTALIFVTHYKAEIPSSVTHIKSLWPAEIQL